MISNPISSRDTLLAGQFQPGRPNVSLQSFTIIYYRHKRYLAYVSGCQVIILDSNTAVLQILTFSKLVHLVAAHETSGRIVVAEEKNIFILDPITEGWAKIWWEKSVTLSRAHTDGSARSLSWTRDGEILIGGSKTLDLYSTRISRRASFHSNAASDYDLEERKPLWSGAVSSPVMFAIMSPSAELIASSGSCDGLVKIWRRLSFEEGLFDYTYLPHRAVITYGEWKSLPSHSTGRRSSGLSSRHEDEFEMLYTIASDSILRIWKTGASHDSGILTLYSSIDLVLAIPSSPSLSHRSNEAPFRQARYVFTISAHDFSDAVTSVMMTGPTQTSHSIEHLKEIASNDPDVFVIIDGHGRMSAWGLQSIGHKRRPDDPMSSQAFHISHSEDLPLHISPGTNARLASWIDNGQIHCVMHDFDGTLQWWEGSLESFLSPSVPGTERLALRTELSSHDRSTIGIASADDGSQALSWTKHQEAILWAVTGGNVLGRLQTISLPARSQSVHLSSDSDTIIFVTDNSIESYSSRTKTWHSSFPLDTDAILMSSITMVEAIIFGITHDGRLRGIGGSINSINEQTESNAVLPEDEEVDLANVRILSGRTDDRTVTLVGINKAGLLITCPLSFRKSSRVNRSTWQRCHHRTNKSDLWHASSHTAVLISRGDKHISIVDLVEGYVEHEELLDEVPTHVLCLPRKRGRQAVALGYPTRVEMLLPVRYACHRVGTRWVRHVAASFGQSGARLVTLSACSDSHVLAGLANGISLIDIDVTTDVRGQKLVPESYHDVPVWHPDHLRTAFLHLGLSHVLRILQCLLDKVKFWTEGDTLDMSDLFADVDSDRDNHVFDAATVAEITESLLEQLKEKRLPRLSEKAHEYLKITVRTIRYVSAHASGLDKWALAYLFEWRFQIVQAERQGAKCGALPDADNHDDSTSTVHAPEMHWREIIFAHHSQTQQPLLDHLILHYDNKVDWKIASALGLTAWLKDVEALRQVFESIGQSAYRSTSPADPVNASLFFLALHKKTALLGLWRISPWHKEQRATLNFLKRDFTQPESKTAAKKNAYALMGKRRFEYAAAFFLLADDATSAVSLLAGQCEDVMLAVAIARLFGVPTDSNNVKDLVQNRLLPLSERQNDRWLMSWCYSLLSERDQAAEALVRPQTGLKIWAQDDPATLLLYQSLRRESSTFEYDALRRGARILRRMGLTIYAVELIRSWKFKHTKERNNMASWVDLRADMNKLNVANGNEHSVVGDSATSQKQQEPSDSMQPHEFQAGQSDQASRQAQAAELLRKMKEKREQGQKKDVQKPKPPPTQFQEPDTNSLLDSFGF